MIELLTTSQMARADALTIEAGVAGIDLMERAGRAVADVVIAGRPASRAIVVCGPGNNGGDGFIAARMMAARGWTVRVLQHGERAALKGDAAEAARRWDGPIRDASAEHLRDADVIVDALLGAGLSRQIEGSAAALIAAINQAGVPIVAVDLPSGINGDTGLIMGTAIRAIQTVTFFRRKPGHLLMPGRAHCGKVTVADIGISPRVLGEVGASTFVNRPALWGGALPIPRLDGHKYSRGHAVVVSGGIASTGAGRLAARGALRAGAGLVTIASPPDALAVNAAASLAVMVRPVGGAGELATLLADRRLNAVVIGPGGGVGAAMREAVQVALGGVRAAVLDADALTSFADHIVELRTMLQGRADPTAILTPHEGEFSRLFNRIPDIAELKSKLDRAGAAARYLGAVIVLKGPDTVVAAPDGRAAIADNAPPWLATAGSGDVLAGMIGGLQAQGMPSFEAAAAAVWLHGEAGAAVGPGLISEDLPEAFPRVYRELLAELGGMRPL